jgi:hypothetical protein
MNLATDAVSEFRRKTEAFQRREVAALLAQCTPEQQSLFASLYPDGPQNDQLETAYSQCAVTVWKNEAKGHEQTKTPKR